MECQADSSALAALNENPDLTATFKELVTTADYNSAFMDLEQGAVDAIAMDVIVAGYQIQQRNADFVILEDHLSAEEYGVGFKMCIRDRFICGHGVSVLRFFQLRFQRQLFQPL